MALNLKACRPIPLFYRWEHSGEVKSRMVNSFHLMYYSLDWDVGLGVLNWKGPEAVHGLGGESWYRRDVCQGLRMRLRLRGRLSARDPEPGARGLTEAPTSKGIDLLPPWGLVPFWVLSSGSLHTGLWGFLQVSKDGSGAALQISRERITWLSISVCILSYNRFAEIWPESPKA